MPSRGYVELIRTNSNFRRIWLAGGISVLGSWFNVVALYTLVRQLTDSPLALGLVFFIRTMSWALASPAAGLIADRFDRRKLMIGADVLRALGVRGVFVIDSASFCISALLLSRTRIPQRTEPASGKRLRDALRDIGAGWRYLRVHPRIGRGMLLFALLAANGVLWLGLVVLPERRNKGLLDSG